ncbi:methylmalonyl-CoA mutase family protein [Nocardioides sp. CER19]|uniref:methylmalonyl-CoA mutase family protein n=1 Tax=Nocardioides sp. CER19 TaxID=3038538 RepID=UPI0024482D78|nr:methylmalonyl-CoA mutase family protein [Nocardioides sp. CER19]MDH2413688.1 methylmalonyl-CoA mutase family protein [Nocardioides sp. CER19]
MTDKPAHLQLAQPEDDHGVAEWEAAAAGVLRKSRRLTEEDADALVWDKLARTTLDGIAVTPLGTPADLEGLTTAGRPTRAGAWDIRSFVADPDAELANESALADLDGGVTSLWVQADADTDLATDLDTVLDGVLLDLAPVVLDAPTAPLQAARALLALVSRTGVEPHPATNLGVDPIGAVHRDLRAEGAWQEDLVGVARLAQELGVLGVVVDATAAHDLGASDAQELGYGLAVGATYLRTLTAAGLSVTEAARLVEFRFAATDEQFPTIAKLRAARRLWARVLELSGADGVRMRLHAVTSRPMLSKYDPYVNMLRGTVAAFAAGVGGADAVTVLPFDSANGRPEAFGRRIARNVNHLLIDESHVAVVADPAGGAYAVERLTDDLAVAGWAELGEIETTGFDTFRGRVATIVERREAEIARRKRPITGLSEFPDLTETLPERKPDAIADRVRRYGASFEELRDTPPAQHVFLATLGTVAQHTARATFASNLLAAGGVAVDLAGATTDAQDLVSKYGGQLVVCLAGSDAAYEQWGAEAAAALRDAGARRVIVAGKPVGPITDAVDDSAALGVDALDFLHRTREALS